MDLDALLGDVKDLKTILGEKAFKMVQAEAKLIKALSKYDLYLDTLNSEIRAYADGMESKPIDDRQIRKIQRDKLARDVGAMTEYVKNAYEVPYSIVLSEPDSILNLDDASIDMHAQNWFKESKRVSVLNSTGALDKVKILYLFDPDSLK